MKKDIYVLKNNVNDKVYVGQTKNARQRWAQHKTAAKVRINVPISMAMHDIGADHFYMEILESNVENYNEREMYWIKKLNSIVPNGYNVSQGGPSSGAGIYNSNSSITSEDQLNDIIFKIKFSQLSFKQIAEICGCSQNAVSEVNRGTEYHINGLKYPLRPKKYDMEKVKQIQYSLKYELDKTISDIAKEYGVDISQITLINSGEIYSLSSQSYPLRKGKVTNPALHHLDEIIDMLRNSDVHQKDIAKKFNVSVNVISGINKGRNYRKDGIEYPIRRNYQCCNGGRTCLTPNEVRDIEHKLANTSMTIREIASEYSLSPTTIMNMNIGSVVKYRNENIKYPIRPKQPVSTSDV